MNKYGPALFRSPALETLHDTHISDETNKQKKFFFLKELKWSKGHEHQPGNAMFLSSTLWNIFDNGLTFEIRQNKRTVCI